MKFWLGVLLDFFLSGAGCQPSCSCKAGCLWSESPAGSLGSARTGAPFAEPDCNRGRTVFGDPLVGVTAWWVRLLVDVLKFGYSNAENTVYWRDYAGKRRESLMAFRPEPRSFLARAISPA